MGEDSCIIQCIRTDPPKGLEKHFLKLILSKKVLIKKFFGYGILTKLCK